MSIRSLTTSRPYDGRRVLAVCALLGIIASLTAELIDGGHWVTIVGDLVAIVLLMRMVVLSEQFRAAHRDTRTVRQSLELQDRQFHAVVSNLPGVVYRCRPRGAGFDFISPAVVDLTGISADQFRAGSRRFDSLIHPDDMPQVEERISRAATTGTAFRLQYRLRLDDGTVIHLRDTGSFSRDPDTGQQWIDGWLFDVTDEVESANRLREAVTEAEEANKAKSAFLAAMSHELRTPLNAIIGFANVVRRSATGRLIDRDLTFLDRVSSNGEHLLGLINDILDLSKIEAGRMEFERAWTDPAPIVQEVIASLEAQALLKGLALTFEAPEQLGVVEIDPTRFRQILINLVGNALKFTETGGVTIGSDVINGRLRALHITDTGIGIAGDRLDAIFRPFEQADAGTTRRFGGTGLGLSLSREMAHQMGCDLVVTSVVGQGSTFTLTIPEERSRIAPRRTPLHLVRVEPVAA
jgi:two-component system, sensor histidine kinase and response regulator